MHGRLKIRTSEEECERKKKEQALKVRAYKVAMDKIQKKRQNQELDDEMLQLTKQILLRNPDVTTLWNIRRECVLAKVDNLKDDVDVAEAALRDNLIAQIYRAELDMTEQCLMVNPKSYNSWHHRCWTLEQNIHSDWQHEVQLCNKYLKLDERNFHTWDYRRYAVGKAGVSKKQELDFCTEKIKVNFSNYSSWHQRSLLLPILYPYKGNARPRRPMSEDKLKQELEMVLTAAFTDPNDSSAWFYQRWLLGNTQPDLGVCAFRCNLSKAVMSFTNQTQMPATVALVHARNDGHTEVVLEIKDWHASNGKKIDTTWFASMPDEHSRDLKSHDVTKLSLSIHFGRTDPLQTQTLPLKSCTDGVYYIQPPTGATDYTPEVVTELQSQLESCMSLLEFEPDSKWTLLTSALLMRAIDAVENHKESLSYLQKLQKVDPLRVGYYQDLASKWALEQHLAQLWTNVPGQLNLTELKHLQSIHYPQYFSIADELILPPALEQKYRQSSSKVQLKIFKEFGA